MQLNGEKGWTEILKQALMSKFQHIIGNNLVCLLVWFSEEGKIQYNNKHLSKEYLVFN